MGKPPTPSLDAAPLNADWTKRAWDLHGVDSIDSLREWLRSTGQSADEFKKLPIYRFNVDKLVWLR